VAREHTLTHASATRATWLLAVVFHRMQLAEKDGFDDEKDAASVAYNAAVKGAAKVGSC